MSLMNRADFLNDVIDEILKLFETKQMTMREVDFVAKALPERVKENNKRLEDNKPFIVAN